ncbi:unnamed protein product [Rotaria magnacalcarata]|uniref:Uncharacterized protein n=1 Tax=Rotaria magnacalcarata TaxID=392030 RepID=A0A819RWJ3_9BILA|nr:unnamed protein product [Rotaria magnacalcarata]CAF4044273.1 unnamed protein product [Rotaria magnacalcarata]
MSDGTLQKNSKHTDNYEEFRFQDAAQAIFFKYQLATTVKTSNTTTITTTPVNMAIGRQVTTIKLKKRREIDIFDASKFHFFNNCDR